MSKFFKRYILQIVCNENFQEDLGEVKVRVRLIEPKEREKGGSLKIFGKIFGLFNFYKK